MRMTETISRLFRRSFKKEWFETYWCFDVHGVIFKPNHKVHSDEAEFYPYVKETLQLLSKRKDIVLILFTSSFPDEIEFYQQIFKENDIHFDFVNENKAIDSSKGNFGYYEKKFYFDILFEDKSGYDAETEWIEVLQWLKWAEEINYLPNPAWSTKY